MKGSIKKFILRSLLASLPFFLLVAFYVFRDPFHVVHPIISNSDGRDSVVAGNNAGFVSVETYLAHNSEQHYDSFIFGSSMSQNFKARDWQQHIGNDASILHFDQKMLRRHPVENDILYAQHPATTGAHNWFNFHCIFFNALRNTSMLKKTILNKIDEEKEQQKRQLNDEVADRTDINNEVYYSIIDSLLEHDPSKFFTPERLATRIHAKLPGQVGPAINEELETQLKTIKEILDKNKTNYLVLVPPCNYKQTLMKPDLWVMKSIFGQDKVYDFSSAEDYVNNEFFYYDKMGHLISAKCKVLLDSAYQEQASPSLKNPFYRL